MIRAKFKHSRKGKVFQRNEEIDNLNSEQEEQAVISGLAYYDEPDLMEPPTDENTVDYIKDYLKQEGIKFGSNLKKDELLELC